MESIKRYPRLVRSAHFPRWIRFHTNSHQIEELFEELQAVDNILGLETYELDRRTAEYDGMLERQGLAVPILDLMEVAPVQQGGIEERLRAVLAQNTELKSQLASTQRELGRERDRASALEALIAQANSKLSRITATFGEVALSIGSKQQARGSSYAM